MKLDVRHVVSTYLPYLAGTGNVVAAYAKFLARRNHEVTVLTPWYRSGDASEELIDGAQIRRLRAPLKWGNAAFTPSLPRELEGADIIHFHAPFLGGAEAMLVHESSKTAPIVVTYHNDVLLDGILGAAARLEVQIFLRHLLGRASVILVPNREFGERCRIARYNWEVLEHGVDLSVFRPDARRPEAIEDFANSKSLLLFVGVLDNAHRYKGLEDVIAALSNLPNCRLAIIGDGERRPYYERLARPLRDRVRFLGARQPKDLASFYGAADVTLFPSREFESFGLVLLESLACGTPVVATDLIGGARELVHEGITGYVVRPRNPAAIAKAISHATDPSFRSAARPSCVQEAGMHAWEAVIDRLIGVYARALQA